MQEVGVGPGIGVAEGGVWGTRCGVLMTSGGFQVLHTKQKECQPEKKQFSSKQIENSSSYGP